MCFSFALLYYFFVLTPSQRKYRKVIDGDGLLLERLLHFAFEPLIRICKHVEKVVDVHIKQYRTVLHDDAILPGLGTSGNFTSFNDEFIPAWRIKAYTAADVRQLLLFLIRPWGC